MTRRQLLAALAAALIVRPLRAGAQPSAAIPHIGYISLGSAASNGAFLDAFRDGLRELGYDDGKNIVIDVRWAGDAPDELPRLAVSIVKDQPKAIIGTCIPSTRAAKQATRTIPVVMSVDGDPVTAGLIASFARPGGNVTGTSTLFVELIPKWVELLVTAAPRIRSVALLHDPADLGDPYYAAQVVQAAKRVGVEVLQFEATGKLPAIYGFTEFARAGGLMSYGVSFRDYYKGVARYVDAVLKGTRPADLPVEQPKRIELVVNLKTAKALGLAIPQALLLRADEVIQ